MTPPSSVADTEIPYSLQRRVDRELEPGEELWWLGAPRPSLLTPSSLVACCVGLIFACFSVVFMVAVSRMEAASWSDGLQFRDAYPLFGLPFLLVGMLLFTVPYWSLKKAQNTVYAITNRRAILFQGILTLSIHTFGPDRLTQVFRRERSNGTGDVIIQRLPWADSDGFAHVQEQGFMKIKDPKKVEDLLRKLARQDVISTS